MKQEEKLNKILLKLASGYSYTETTEEFAIDKDSNQMILVKRKVTTHQMPPDMAALKLLSGEEQYSLESLTDEELLSLKQKFLEELKEENNDN